ncbi:MAG: FAD:protein FMN transferase [Candidatus Krumholzibacteria bacterium]
MITRKLWPWAERAFDRRGFLKACGIFGIGAAGGGALQALFEVVRVGRDRVRVSRSRIAMGTYVTITAVHASADHAEEAIGRAFEEMERLIAILSRHDTASPVAVLNSEGIIRRPPAELVEVVQRALDLHRTSRGAFDITVKPLVDLFEKSPGQGGAMPTDGELRDALARVGSDGIEMADGHIRFSTRGMGITLDGIAKGYVVDQISQVLSARGIDDHLVNAGGDIRTRGRRADGRPWTVAVEDPEKKGRYPEVLRLTSAAVATSGSYEIYYDREKVYNHLVDPHTGRSPHYSKSVTVTARSVMQADALATAVFVMGPGDGLRLIDSTPQSACLMLGDGGERHRSAGWKAQAL